MGCQWGGQYHDTVHNSKDSNNCSRPVTAEVVYHLAVLLNKETPPLDPSRLPSRCWAAGVGDDASVGDLASLDHVATLFLTLSPTLIPTLRLTLTLTLSPTLILTLRLALTLTLTSGSHSRSSVWLSSSLGHRAFPSGASCSVVPHCAPLCSIVLQRCSCKWRMRMGTCASWKPRGRGAG